jgi:hypothetical protein
MKFTHAIALPALAVAIATALPAVAAEEGAGRYQIMKATETTVWRLDTKTGEIVACQFEGSAMVCGSTDKAITRDKTTYDQYKAEKNADRQARQAEELAFFEKLVDIFKSLVAFFMEQERVATKAAAAPECPK